MAKFPTSLLRPVRCLLPFGLLSLAVACQEVDPDTAEMGFEGDAGSDVEKAATQRTTYQAEGRTFQSKCSETTGWPGYSGAGFMECEPGGILEWSKVSVPSAGRYTVKFRYANGSQSTQQGKVTVNDGTSSDVAFPATGGWATWKTKSMTVTLTAGVNKLRLTLSSASDVLHLDKLVLTADSGGGDNSGSNSGGSTTGKCAEAAEWEDATLSCSGGEVIRSITFASYGTPTGTCDSGYQTGSCHASASQSKVAAMCVGRTSCTVSATNDVFDDPCGGVGKRVRVAYACGAGDGSTGGGNTGGGGTSGGSTGGDGTSMPVFLLAGQSNMVGNVDGPLFDDLLRELTQGASSGQQARLESRLRSWYLDENDGYAEYGYSASMVTFEATELRRLRASGLVDSDLTRPLANVLCAMNAGAVAPLTTNCGNPFGPELLMGHVLGANMTTSLIKVAQGGTSLYTDWRSPRSGGSVGPLYEQLKARIRSLRSNPASVHPACASRECRWGGFIWFQGENDTFDQANAQSYAQNLKNLIADVRQEAGLSDLPVVIVGIGKWAQSMDFGSVVASAQRSVADADPRAVIVKTDDLSGFFHYDPAAQLIIGERVALALKSM